ncbi:MAG TPA: hypothetical protein PK299_02170 [Anaerolineales bacterium]|nr:hypothetical protein [Anaerolineales bacterium]
MINFESAVFISLLSLLGTSLLFFRKKTVLLGYSIFTYIGLFRASHSAFFADLIDNKTRIEYNETYYYFYIFSAIGMFLFSLGVLISWNKIKQEYPIQYKALTPILTQTNILIFIFIGLIATTLLFFSSKLGLSSLNVFLVNAENLVNLGVILSIIYSRQQNNPSFFYKILFIYILYLLIKAVSSGHLGFGIGFLLQISIVYVFIYNFSKKSVFQLIIFIPILIIIANSWLSVRGIIRNGSIRELRLDQQVSQLVISLSEDIQSESSQSPLEGIYGRVDMSSILIAQTTYQPKYQPFVYGKTIIDSLYFVVPRIIWRNKPIVTGGSAYVSKFTGLTFAKGTSVDLPYQFELFANWGWFGVFGGLFVIGYFIGTIERVTINYAGNIPIFLGLFGFLGGIASTEKQIMLSISSGLIAMLGLFVIAKYSYQPLRNYLDKKFFQKPQQINGKNRYLRAKL